MTELSTEVKNQMIIFHDGSKMPLTEEHAKQIMQYSSMSQYKGLKIGNMFINFSSIAKLLSLEDYYQQYPDDRPAPQNLFKPEPREAYESIETRTTRVESNRNGLIRGLQQFIDEQNAKSIIPHNAIAMLQRWQLKSV